MGRRSEFSSYVFIKNDLANLGWITKNPTRNPDGQLYTQQECLDHDDIGKQLNRLRPEYVVKIKEDAFWVIEAKGSLNQIETAVSEALDYAKKINKSPYVKARIYTGVAGNDDDGYLVETHYIDGRGRSSVVNYNGKAITGFLSPDQARYVVDNSTNELNELVADESVLMQIAEDINEELHRASINKDLRATAIASILLAMISDTLPNFNASPDVFVKDINNRAEDVLIHHNKREFAEYIELKLPQDDSAKLKFKAALVKVFFLLRKINIKAAMDGGQDLLGKFYEVFLKYGNGAKDIGIVLTPRHITEFASEILDINSNDVVFDLACGTGGFLVAGYDRVRRLEPENVDMFKKYRIFGIEQQANVAALAIVNMIFRGDGKNNIINGDCFKFNLNRKLRNNELSAEYLTEDGDRKPVTKVLMNPPFALKREDEQEYKFIDHALNQMAPEGLLLCVLPISVMYASGKEFEWRKRLLKSNSLLAVMTVPNDLFYPQASVEPAIVVIKKGVPHSTNRKTLFVRIIDDGFVKLKKRRLPKGGTSQLIKLTQRIKRFIQSSQVAEESGVIQAKVISTTDNLELIPQQYLDNQKPDEDSLRKSMASLYSEVVFQDMRRGLQK